MTRSARFVRGAVILAAVTALGSGCSSDGGDSPAGGKSAPAGIPDPRSAPLPEAQAPSLPPRSPEFPPDGATSLEQLQLEGKVDVLNK